MYQCFIRNDQESAGASAELKLGGRCKITLILIKYKLKIFSYKTTTVFTITVEPPLIRHSFGEQTLRSGPSLRLKCVASGNPTPDIVWLLDGDKLNSGERLQIGQFVTADGNVESHLNISSVHTNDGGLYSCIASSKVCLIFGFWFLTYYSFPTQNASHYFSFLRLWYSTSAASRFYLIYLWKTNSLQHSIIFTIKPYVNIGDNKKLKNKIYKQFVALVTK